MKISQLRNIIKEYIKETHRPDHLPRWKCYVQKITRCSVTSTGYILDPNNPSDPTPCETWWERKNFYYHRPAPLLSEERTPLTEQSSHAWLQSRGCMHTSVNLTTHQAPHNCWRFGAADTGLYTGPNQEEGIYAKCRVQPSDASIGKNCWASGGMLGIINGVNKGKEILCVTDEQTSFNKASIYGSVNGPTTPYTECNLGGGGCTVGTPPDPIPQALMTDPNPEDTITYSKEPDQMTKPEDEFGTIDPQMEPKMEPKIDPEISRMQKLAGIPDPEEDSEEEEEEEEESKK